MFCAAHTLQLAIKDAFHNNLDAKIALQTARRAVKILRRPNLKNVLRASNLNKPVIDCPTRWTSTYQMLARLYLLRDVQDSDLTSIFSDSFWIEIQNLIACLKPVYEATIALQREQLTIGDFFTEWLNCKIKLEAIRTSFAEDLVKAMQVRETVLLNNDLVLENLYLDGRLNVILSDQECEKAKTLITQTFQQLQSLTLSDSPTETSELPDYSSTRQHGQTTSALENYLKETEATRGLAGRSSLNTFDGMLSKLRFEPRLPLNTNILTHWVSKGASIDPSLMKVVNVVFAAPATQVSVERLFSSVKFILNPLRSNMSGSLLKDIMLIRSNPDLFE
ncbi:hypothetical protein HF086_006167 [Spodoptera exigua]|uniref:HAT C-terminal dimerisation domain-containing protein n=1 Tax=Spodoptera exigua TaxID=7107 RepID=A0A922SFG9_SPOEX|nr:hypothetical protein HF086_006167 [Spodoptera exigua]